MKAYREDGKQELPSFLHLHQLFRAKKSHLVSLKPSKKSARYTNQICGSGRGLLVARSGHAFCRHDRGLISFWQELWEMSFAAELWKLRTEERSLGCARARELKDDISSRIAEGTMSPFCLDLARYGNCAGSTVFLG